MHFLPFSSFGAAVVVTVVAANTASGYTTASTAQTDQLAAVALGKLSVYAVANASPGPRPKCTLANAAKRREWGSLSTNQRKDYTRAVKCLMNKPSRFDPVEVPGAKSRFDDFVAVHINQTLGIHGTANFLSWHRYFTWAYEQALRTECGYQGYQPYWNWGRWAQNPLDSPLFDGSASSMGGNGAFAPHNCTNALPTGLNCIPPGNGGGCVASGPFADMSVNLGPISLTLVGIPGLEPIDFATAPGGLLAYNPRCLRRDISSWVSQRWSTDRNSTDLITQSNDIVTFQTTMQGDFAAGDYGVHAAGHFTIGGDPGGDLFTSPGDPVFYLHHAQIDRTWWIWQNQKPAERTNAIGGPVSLFDPPPVANGTLQDLVDLGPLTTPAAGAVPIAKLMSTVGLAGSPMCYIYV
ncbi:hypothetical protein B0H66DRAFT_563793 [Apodospora peruviana]|uniref:Tyrosinase copper-binding domain-containing protein n=1 Tax=Apodospora peruviana TaxID=516989 RepID=A0AAE0HXU4_9PEZI|nr:hypothetical protein B0H66DRAFT_563793 [Apodospora peruviana]